MLVYSRAALISARASACDACVCVLASLMMHFKCCPLRASLPARRFWRLSFGLLWIVWLAGPYAQSDESSDANLCRFSSSVVLASLLR